MPTVLYLAKGENAKLEHNILLNLLEEYENGKRNETRTFGKSKTTDTILGRDWVQEKRSLTNNYDRTGETRGNTGYASILQGESSEFIGNPTLQKLFSIHFVASNKKSKNY